MTQPLKTYLRTHRLRSCFTQDEVAFLLGAMCGASVQRHESGDRLPYLKTALSYAFIFGADVRVLYEGVYVEAQGTVKQRARGLLAGLQRKPANSLRDQKIAILTRLLADAEPSTSHVG